jgi:hypothetical protein
MSLVQEFTRDVSVIELPYDCLIDNGGISGSRVDAFLASSKMFVSLIQPIQLQLQLNLSLVSQTQRTIHHTQSLGNGNIDFVLALDISLGRNLEFDCLRVLKTFLERGKGKNEVFRSIIFPSSHCLDFPHTLSAHHSPTI